MLPKTVEITLFQQFFWIEKVVGSAWSEKVQKALSLIYSMVTGTAKF
jgi:hypothetical protein